MIRRPPRSTHCISRRQRQMCIRDSLRACGLRPSFCPCRPAAGRTGAALRLPVQELSLIHISEPTRLALI
eukprot:10502100-Alexandrium_andersonii.AAC.1